MRVLVLYAHPDETSYCAALHRTAVSALERAGHEVDDCDLYEEGFDPILSRAERAGYHDLETNTAAVQSHVDRLRGARALVIVAPVWNFGFPAILKGYFDRVFLPGVSFRMEHRRVVGNLNNIERITAVLTYGGARWRAIGVGDPPRRIVTRVLRGLVKPFAPIRYLAHYDMNRSTDASRAAFLARVERELEKF